MAPLYRGRSGRADFGPRLSLLSGLAVVLVFFGGMAFRWEIWGIWFAVVAGWAWLAAMSVRLSSTARD
jgi:hypothetical protein